MIDLFIHVIFRILSGHLVNPPLFNLHPTAQELVGEEWDKLEMRLGNGWRHQARGICCCC